MGDAAKAIRLEKKHLRFPAVRVQRSAVTENDGLPPAPALEIDLCAVTGSDRVHVVNSDFSSSCSRYD